MIGENDSDGTSRADETQGVWVSAQESKDWATMHLDSTYNWFPMHLFQRHVTVNLQGNITSYGQQESACVPRNTVLGTFGMQKSKEMLNDV